MTATLSDRLRALHAARVPCYVHDTPAHTITATDERWQALLDAAEALEHADALRAPAQEVERVIAERDAAVASARHESDLAQQALDDLRTVTAERDVLRAELEVIKHENHNLNWALGVDGYERMYTDAEQADADEAHARTMATIDHMVARKARHDKLVPEGTDPLDLIERLRAELEALRDQEHDFARAIERAPWISQPAGEETP